jgi:general secretion pathway protein D
MKLLNPIRKNFIGAILLILMLFLPAVHAAESNATGHAPQKGQFVSIDFNNVDISVFIKFISELTGKNFIVDNRVKGKVTVISPSKISVEEAYLVFESVLEVHGFTTITAGKIIKVVPAPDARGKNIETRLMEESENVEDRVVTRLIQLKYATPAEVKKLFTPLISKSSVLLAYQPTGMLIVTDVLSNIQRLLKILKAIDVDGVGREISVIPLEFADATKLEKIVAKIFAPSAKKGSKTALQNSVTLVADERINSIIAVANEDHLERVKGLIALLDREVPRGKGKIRVYYLENATAEEMAKVLQEIPEKGAVQQKGKQPLAVTGKVKITADKATNSLIITAEKDDYDVLEEVIAKLDIPRSMVYIECLIMEVNVDKEFDLGTEWQGFGGTQIDGKSGAFGGGFSASDSGLLTNLAGGALPAGASMGVFSQAITIGGVSFNNIAAIIKAFKKDKDIHIISTPQILTTDNEEAKIYIGKNLPFQTNSTINSNDNTTYDSYEYKDVGTSLKITPQISQERLVRLVISQEVSTLESTSTDLRPTTLKRTIDTTVIVTDGSTVVIGGLIEDNESESEQKVPLLGDIPILGWLFKTRAESNTKTNLFVFITPRVIKTPGEADQLFRKKKSHIDKLSDQKNALDEMEAKGNIKMYKEAVENDNETSD